MTQSLSEWLDQLATRHPVSIDMGLDRIRIAQKAMGLHLSMPIILVGGTNGKGSVCAILASILQAGGIRAGCYTSPHLLRFNERIQINGDAVADNILLSAFEEVEKARIQSAVSLSYFEFITLAAALIFNQTKVEVAIFEVGLGGRLDAVNIFEPLVSIITNVGFDHQEYLGDSLAQIAIEKAGIARPKINVIVSDKKSLPLLQVGEPNAHWLSMGKDFLTDITSSGWHYRGQRSFYNLPYPTLRGRHQIMNAATAIAALENSPLWAGVGAVRKGLHAASAMGRAQVLAGNPLTIVDVAHNQEAAQTLEQMLFDMGYFSPTAAILGMMARKNPEAFIKTLRRRIDKWYVVRPQGGDLPATKLAQWVTDAGQDAVVCDNMKNAIRQVHEYCGDNGRIVVTGSFMTVADYMQCL